MPGLKLIAELGGDGRGFEKMMDKASGAISGLGGHLAALFSIGAITAFTKETLDWAGALQDVADGLSVNVEWFQKMANGAALAGAKQEDLAKFLADLNKSRGESIAGGESGAQKTAAFGRLGISATDISSLNTEQFFQKLIDRFKNGMDARGLDDLREVGGKSARTLAAAFATQFESDASILSADVVSQLDTAGDSLTDFATMLKVLFAPAVVWVLDKITDSLNGLKAAAAFITGTLADLKKTGMGHGMDNIQAGLFAATDSAFQSESEKETRQKARASAVEAAKQRAAARPDFGPILGSANKDKKSSLDVDSFAKVGRFMGQSGNAVNYVASQQLKVAQDHLQEQKRTNTILQNIAWTALSNAKYDVNRILPPDR